MPLYLHSKSYLVFSVVREGSCPATPANCQNVTGNADICKSNDRKCNNGEKCCTFFEGGMCLKKCVKAQKGIHVVNSLSESS